MNDHELLREKKRYKILIIAITMWLILCLIMCITSKRWIIGVAVSCLAYVVAARDHKNRVLGKPAPKEPEPKASDPFADAINCIPRVAITPDRAATDQRRDPAQLDRIRSGYIGKTFDRAKLHNFVVIDTETTGLSPADDRIVQLSAVRYEDFCPVSAFCALVDPQVKIPRDASRIHGITQADVKGAPTIGQISQQFVDYLGSDPIVGYNLEFDLNFLYASGLDFEVADRKYYDALSIARKTIEPHDGSYKLTSVASHYGIDLTSAHDALSDAVATGMVFARLIDDITAQR